MSTRRRFILPFLLLAVLMPPGLTPAALFLDSPLLFRKEFTVHGAVREALIYAPASAKTNKTPVVFVFHGHGGTSRNAARSFHIHQDWPEAISVYMQGLNTPGRLTDPEGKRSGWQMQEGDQGDRDLKFFDALLTWLKEEYKIDLDRIHATGHSNGGAFTYLLWAERGDVFASVAPSAAATNPREFVKLAPKPAMHMAGEKDTLVKFEWQKLCMNAVRRLNRCPDEGKAWAPGATIYESARGEPFVSVIHDGGHQFLPTAPALIVRFFKEHPTRTAKD